VLACCFFLFRIRSRFFVVFFFWLWLRFFVVFSCWFRSRLSLLVLPLIVVGTADAIDSFVCFCSFLVVGFLGLSGDSVPLHRFDGATTADAANLLWCPPVRVRAGRGPIVCAAVEWSLQSVLSEWRHAVGRQPLQCAGAGRDRGVVVAV
jgi:hypothetical protein